MCGGLSLKRIKYLFQYTSKRDGQLLKKVIIVAIGVLFAGVWTGWLWSIGGPQLVFSITAGVALISFFILRWNASKINIHSV